MDKHFNDLTGVENNEIWLSQKEVTDIENITERTFWRRIQGYRYTYRYVSSSNGGRGGRRVEVALSSLSPEGQRRYVENLYTSHVTTKELVEQFQLRIPHDKLNDPRTASMVRMIVECMAVPPGARGRRERIKEIAEGYGWHVGSAYRLLKRVEQGKALGAERKAHGVRLEELGITVRAWDEKAARIAVGMILDNKRRKVDGLTLYQWVRDTAKAEELRVGSYRSFMTIKKRIDATPLATFRDKGRQGLRQDVIPPIRRDPTAYKPMECLVGDQHKADYYAFDNSGKVVTLELFCWMDFRTQMVWGSIAYQHYNRYTVGRAFVNAVRWGLPSMAYMFAYTDQGRPERSKYFDYLRKQMAGIGIKTDIIEHVLATGRHPQAKPIEGFFGNFDGQLRNAEIPGYCKRLKDTRENELQQKELKEMIRGRRLLSIDELTAAVFEQLEQWNIHRFKNRGADNGRSPMEIYTEEVKRYPVTALSEEVLEYVFLPVRKEKIKRSQVAFKHEWLGRKVYHDRALADYQGMTAEVRYDPYEPWRAWVFVEGKLICVAEEWGMINPKVGDQVAAKMAEQKRLEKNVVEIYKKHLPPRAPVRRLNPKEREAKEMRRAQSAERIAQRNIRVMETTLERRAASSGLRGAGSGDALAEFRRQFQPGARPREEEKEPRHRPLFKSSMKQLKQD